MLLETAITILTFAALGLLPPTERQRSRSDRGYAGRSLGEQLATLRRAGVVRRR